jgi:Rrf2 family protein
LKFSTRTRYGLRAMIEIAKHSPGTGVFQKDIATAQEISNKYLDHIIHGLKAAGLIANLKGKKSGYVLTKPPEKITVLDIHSAFEPGICVIDCMSENFKCDRENGCEARGFWSTLNRQVSELFESTTLRDFLDKKELI